MPYRIEVKNGAAEITAEGKNAQDVFVAGALGLFHHLTGRENIHDDERVKIAIQAPSISALFKEWLDTLLMRADGERIALGEFRVASLQKVGEEYLLTGEAYGEASADAYTPGNVHISSCSCKESEQGYHASFSVS